MEQSELTATLLALDSLSIYRGLIEDKVLNKLKNLLIKLDQTTVIFRDVINSYNDFFFELTKSHTSSWKEYIIEKILFDENTFSFNSQVKQDENLDGTLEKAVSNDLENLQLIANLEPTMIKARIAGLFRDNKIYSQIIDSLPEWMVKAQLSEGPEHIRLIKENYLSGKQWNESIAVLKDFYKQYGSGIFARYIAFVWERIEGNGFLKGIDSPDPITLNDLVDYQNERLRVVENTRQFLQGFPANNVLLYGDRGTGKSSTVKAILNEYHQQGLRMLEVPKAYLADFPLIIRQLKNRGLKFIIFVDDLVFGDNEENYTSLKAVLEGGLETKTPNILIYATSNRRHLIKEYFSERAGLQSSNHDEEVHAGDSMQEKLSLADRFGIYVVYSSPDQKRYLNIVRGIAAQRDLQIDKERLEREALQWALRYNGRSARTARQFVDWLEGQISTIDL